MTAVTTSAAVLPSASVLKEASAVAMVLINLNATANAAAARSNQQESCLYLNLQQ
jgi:hypothetical protein